MRNRKRRTLQPTLEAMEPRVAPSVTVIHVHQGRPVVSHVDQLGKPVEKANDTQHAINAGLRRLQQQLSLIHTHSLERTPSAAETPAEKVTTETSSLFKSVLASL
jgi:hypothetical protein